MKIELKRLKLSDAKRILELVANDKVLKNLLIETKAKNITLKQEKEWIARALKDYKTKNPKNYDLSIVVNNQIIGAIGAKEIDYQNKKTEIGYWIGENYWGKGYVSKAIKQFDKVLRKKFKLVRIEAIPFSHNLASQKVLEKAGYKYEGERRKSIYKKGSFLNDKIYSKIK